MPQRRIPAIYMRGGSSKGVFFHAADLPADAAERDRLLLAVIGSPDPYGRQLNGMGGGVSSVSKAVMIAPPTRPGADLDYTFGQVAIGQPVVDYSANCGNLSSAVGPFAIDTGLVGPGADAAGNRVVSIHNTNSGKLIRATVPMEGEAARVDGAFAIPGVAGTGARIRLDFLDPGGTRTGALLPTGRPLDVIDLGADGSFEVTLIDAAVPCVFVAGARLGVTCAESVPELEGNAPLMALLERLRRAAAVRMGLAATPEAAAAGAPKIGMVAPTTPWRTLAGETLAPDSAEMAARVLSMGQVHRVLPLTVAMCLAVACRVAGTVCHAAASGTDGDIRLANPSGVLPVDARVVADGNGWRADHVTVYRTARTLMEGAVLVPA